MFSLIVHPGAEAWRPPEASLEKLRDYFSEVSGQVHIWPRSLVDQVTGRAMGPHAFRGFTRGPVSHLFVDQTETPQSIAWLMAHELAHHTVRNNRALLDALNLARPKNHGGASDRFHEIDPQEIYCDGIASNILGYRMDRTWWRDRIPKPSYGAAAAMMEHRYGFS